MDILIPIQIRSDRQVLTVEVPQAVESAAVNKSVKENKYVNNYFRNGSVFVHWTCYDDAWPLDHRPYDTG